MISKLTNFFIVVVLFLYIMPAVNSQETQSAHSANPPATVLPDSQPDSQNDIFKFEDTKPMSQPNFKLILSKVILTLIFIIGAIYGVIFLIGYFLKDKKNLFNKKEKYIEVVDRLYLDNRKAVYLIKIIDEVLVVGATCESMNLLSKITEPDKVQAMVSREFLPLLDLFHKKIEHKDNKDA